MIPIAAELLFLIALVAFAFPLAPLLLGVALVLRITHAVLAPKEDR
jgi:hypothetical protein